MVVAQAGSVQAQEEAIQRDMRFVRGLATKLGFIALAQESIGEMKQEYRNSPRVDELSLLGIEIDLLGAKIDPDREAQRRLFKEAVEKSTDFLSRNSSEDAQLQAQTTLAAACEEYGQFVLDELEIAREEDPTALKGLEEEAKDLFQRGIEACEAVMNSLEDRIDDDQSLWIEHKVIWMRKGMLQREQGRAIREDQAYLVDNSKETLLDLIFEVGEETALGLKSMFEIAKGDEVLGNIDDATQSYQDAIDQIVNSLSEADTLGIAPQTQILLFGMMQEIYASFGNALLTAGKGNEVLPVMQKFREHMAQFGAEGEEVFDIVDKRYGHLALLNEARAQAESADKELVQQGLAMAKRINDEHPNDIVGIKAKSVLSQILANDEGAATGKLLYEIARGDYQNKDFEKALVGLKKALAAMNAEEKAELGLQAWSTIGRTYLQTDRYMEGAMAMQEGLETFGQKGDELSEDMADLFDRAVKVLGQKTKDDPALEELGKTRDDLLTRFGDEGSASSRYYKKGNDLLYEAKYAEAAAEYGKVVDLEYLRHDQAKSRQIYALVLADDVAAAKQALQDFNAYMASPEGIIPKNRSDRRQVREGAIAEAEFASAMLGFNEATGTAGEGSEKRLEAYPAAVEQLRAFVSKHEATGDKYLPRAWDLIARLEAEAGSAEAAEEAYRNVRSSGNATLTSRLATVLFSSLLERVKVIDEELAQAYQEDGKSEVTDKLEKNKKALQTRGLELGLEYSRTDATPQYGIMRNTVSLADRLERWDEVDEISRRMIDTFGGDPALKQKIDAFIRPQVGKAALEQRKFQVAYDMLFEAEKASNSPEIKRLLARALGGWVAVDDRGNPTVVPGLGRPDEAYTVFFVDYKKQALRDVEDHTLAWYQFQWSAYWYARQAISKDSKYKNYASKLYGSARSFDSFAKLSTFGPKGDELKLLFLQFPPK